MKIKINNVTHKAHDGETILTACTRAHINIPTLCYAKNIGAIGSCRVCAIEVVGIRNLVMACNTPVHDGMEIITNSKRVLEARRTVLELLLADHRLDCEKCIRSRDCRLKRAAENARCNAQRFERNKEFKSQDTSNSFIRRANDKCILCERCVRVCSRHQRVGVLAVNGRGFDSNIGVAWNKDLQDVPCIACGQCLVNCPTAALYEVDRLEILKDKLADPDTHVVIATAPSTRVTLGEGFGLKVGTDVTGKMVSTLKSIGFDRVFDLDLAADFTIMEEATEFLKRLEGCHCEHSEATPKHSVVSPCSPHVARAGLTMSACTTPKCSATCPRQNHPSKFLAHL
jgi:NADP-reducing hydrogenase subunit HndD